MPWAAPRFTARREPVAVLGDHLTATGVGGGRHASRRQRGSEVAALAVCTLLATWLVLHDLGARSLWLDEAFTFGAASQHGGRLLPAVLEDAGNAVAYYLGMHFWTGVFGDTETALRAPSALAAIGMVPVCYYLVRRLFGAWAAVLSAACVAVSLPMVWWGQDARAYVPAVFLTCCSTLAFVVAVQARHRWAWAVYFALSVLAAYTLLLSVLVVLAQAISLLGRRRGDIQWRALVLPATLSATALVPLAWVGLDHGTRPIQWIPPPGPLLSRNNLYFVDFLASSKNVNVPFHHWQVDSLTCAVLLCWTAALALAVRSTRQHPRGPEAWGYLLLLSWLLLPPVVTWVFSKEVQPVFSDRYILFSVVGGSMLTGVALSRVPWRTLGAAAAITILALRAAVILPSYGVPLENWRIGVTNLVAHSKPGDCIAFFVADAYMPFDYYVVNLHLRGVVPQLVLPRTTWGARSAYAEQPQSFTPAQFEAVTRSCARLWLVTSHAGSEAPGPGVLAYRALVYRTEHYLVSEITSAYNKVSALDFLGAKVALYMRNVSRVPSSGFPAETRGGA